MWICCWNISDLYSEWVSNHLAYLTHTNTHTRSSQTADRQSADPLPPLIFEPSLRKTVPTWNSLASLLGLPSGTVLHVCVCVSEEKKHRVGGREGKLHTLDRVVNICIHGFPLTQKGYHLLSYLGLGWQTAAILWPHMLNWHRHRKYGRTGCSVCLRSESF